MSNTIKPHETGLLNQTTDCRRCECTFHAVFRKRIFMQDIVIPESAKFAFMAGTGGVGAYIEECEVHSGNQHWP